MPAFLRLTLFAAFLAAPLFAADEVTIKKTDASSLGLADKAIPLYSVTAKTYSVEIYPNGRVRILNGKTELISSMVFGLGRAEKVMGDIELEKDSTIILREGEVKKYDNVDDMLGNDGGDKASVEALVKEARQAPSIKLSGYALHFLPDRIEFSLADLRKPQGRVDKKTGKREPPPSFDLYGVFGADALAVKNLRLGTEDALPTARMNGPHEFSFGGRIGQYWPDIEITCRNGAKLEMRGISGLGAAFGPYVPYQGLRKDAGRGHWGLTDAQPNNKIAMVIASPKEPLELQPAPYYTIRADQARGMFNENERVLYHLELKKDCAEPGKYKLQWTLEDHHQNPAGGGEQEVTLEAGKIGDLTVDLTPKGMGFFRAKLVMTRAEGIGAKRTHEFSFARLRLERPEPGDRKDTRSLLGYRGARDTPSLAEIWLGFHDDKGEIDWKKYGESRAAEIANSKRGTVRAVVNLMSGSPNEGDIDKWFEKTYGEEVEKLPVPSETLELRAPDKDKDKGNELVEAFEKEEAKAEKEKAAEKEKVKKKDWKELLAEARLRWLEEWARYSHEVEGVDAWEPINEPNLGMSQQGYTDGLLKPYFAAIKKGNPNANFLGGSICGLDNQAWVRQLYAMKADKYFDGISFHPYYGGGFQEGYRAEIDQWWQIMRDYQADLSKGLWMTESAWHRGWGFNDYMYDSSGARRDSLARNMVDMFLNAEAMGIPRERVYVFYEDEHGYNDFYLMHYNEPTAAAIGLQVMNECLRDTKFVKEIPLPGKGHYFQIYRDATRTVAVAFTGSEPAPLTVVTTAAEVTATDIMGNRQLLKPENGGLRLTISGDPTYLIGGPNDDFRPSYEGLEVQPNLALITLGARAVAAPPANETPLALQGDWTGHSTDRYGWVQPGKWPDLFEVKLPAPAEVCRVRVALDYGGWERTLRDYDVQVFTGGAWKTVEQVRDNYYGTIMEHRFEPVVTDRIRLSVAMVNACLYEKNDSWLKKESCLRALDVYAKPQGKAKAFFQQDLPRKFMLRSGDSAELTFTVRNALKTELAGVVKLRLPAGVVAEPQEQAVTIPAEGAATCAFKVRLEAKAAEGSYGVLAGLYETETLISSDYAARVLTCKNPK